MAQAEEPPSASPAFTPAPQAKPQTAGTQPALPAADYPEDFSQPTEMAAALESRYEAFGEDEIPEQPPARAPALDKPFE